MSVTGEPDRPPDEGRRRHRRRHVRHVRDDGDPGRAASPREDGRGPVYRPVAARFAGRLARQCRPQLPDLEARCRSASATSIRTSCPTTCCRAPTATSSWPSATIRQFQKFCDFAGAPELATDPRFVTNEARVKNRARSCTSCCRRSRGGRRRPNGSRAWPSSACPAAPSTPSTRCSPTRRCSTGRCRSACRTRCRPTAWSISSAIPIKYSGTPVDYALPPPYCGQHTDEVLKELLAMPAAEIAGLRERGIV